MLYTTNTFVLKEKEVKTIFDQNPYACRMRVIKILDCQPIILSYEADAESTFALLDLLAAKCDKLISVGVPYTIITIGTQGRKPEPSTVFAGLTFIKLGLIHADLDPPRYPFMLFIFNNLVKNIWTRFTDEYPEGVPIEMQVADQGAMTFFASLSLAEPTEEDLIKPAMQYLGMFEAAFKLLDHDKEHPDEPEEFGRVPECFQGVVRELAKTRDYQMPEFRKLAESESDYDLAWLHNLLAIVSIETQGLMESNGPFGGLILDEE